MRPIERALYWAIAGALIGFGVVAIMGIGLPFLLVGIIMGSYGLTRIERRGLWAALVGFGILPTLLLLSVYLRPRNCGPGCDIYVPDSTFYGAMLFGAIALTGAVWGLIEVLRERKVPHHRP